MFGFCSVILIVCLKPNKSFSQLHEIDHDFCLVNSKKHPLRSEL
nr:MAG TPA: hypothetical protein [Caudoviricetes sp.]